MHVPDPLNERIDHFSFWQPVAFTLTDNPGTTKYNKWAYFLGSLADQYASLNTETLHVNAQRINARKIYFEKAGNETPSLLVTASKVISYILSFGVLLAVALVIKLIFKNHLNTSLVLTKKSPNEVFYEKEFGKTKIVLLYGSIIDETTDAIVNAANERLLAGGGVCGIIHKAAGDQPFDECQDILTTQERRFLNCGEAVLTSSGDLAPRIKAIVHAVGPDYRVDEEKENGKDLLTSAYRNSLEVGHDQLTNTLFISKEMQGKAFHSIAFPSISTGIFKAPLDEAATVALKTIKDFIEDYPDAYEEVRFIFLPLAKDPNTAPTYEAVLKDLK